ncbi:hypothetical protein [Peribacillus frigoritolerans]|uniref:hypothetical protein n=1 Tax=Peribacillus frigoritolerans TaxID=450367 RepID=UPI0039A15278
MNPVVSLDVAKGESQVQAFLDQSKPYGLINSSFFLWGYPIVLTCHCKILYTKIN